MKLLDLILLIFCILQIAGGTPQRYQNPTNKPRIKCSPNCLKCDERAGGVCQCHRAEFGQCMYCKPGFYGPNCFTACPAERYGHDCTLACKCLNNGTCDPQTGACRCTVEYTGIDCGVMFVREHRLETIVKQHWQDYSSGCDNKCKNGGICDPVKKTCSCPPGFQGFTCSSKCTEGTYGDKCSQKCNCQRKATCDHITGVCNCTEGTFGMSCEFSRTEILEDIKNNLLNELSAGCNHTCNSNGNCIIHARKCECFPGYQGQFCGTTCPNGFFGNNCTGICDCKNDGVCDHVTGKCLCSDEWIGENCGISMVEMEDRLMPKYLFYLILTGLIVIAVITLCCIQMIWFYLVCRKDQQPDNSLDDGDAEIYGSIQHTAHQPVIHNSTDTSGIFSVTDPVYAVANPAQKIITQHGDTEVYSNSSMIHNESNQGSGSGIIRNIPPIDFDEN